MKRWKKILFPSPLSLRNCRVVVTIIARDEEKENKSFFLEKKEARLNLRWKEGEEKSWTRFVSRKEGRRKNKRVLFFFIRERNLGAIKKENCTCSIGIPYRRWGKGEKINVDLRG